MINNTYSMVRSLFKAAAATLFLPANKEKLWDCVRGTAVIGFMLKGIPGAVFCSAAATGLYAVYLCRERYRRALSKGSGLSGPR